MTYVTLGGVTVGICILIRHLVEWWPGIKGLRSKANHQAAALAPWAYCVLAVLGVGGLVGAAARTTLWISNWLGDVALVWGVAGQRVTRVSYLPLTATGGAVVLILTVALFAAAKKSRYGSDIKRGAWCGICLGTSAGVAGFAAVPLAQCANWLGGHVYGAIT
ncbi:hypothetical protein [Streptomyces sp. NRRL S-813]|uniref:hypothetical protein n=1 Tax=Streptomyces sp. NRRL S-813 TaxID=1463919 RepID=UPI0004BF6860|nr:hypothetical protein [Streptomyces sp. NRRL S-813]